MVNYRRTAPSVDEDLKKELHVMKFSFAGGNVMILRHDIKGSWRGKKKEDDAT